MNIREEKIEWIKGLVLRFDADVYVDIKPGHTQITSTCVRRDGKTTIRVFTNHECWQIIKKEIERVGYHKNRLLLVSELLGTEPEHGVSESASTATKEAIC